MFTAVRSQAGERDDLTPPPVPTDIQVPAEAELFLIGHGVGTQNYVCVPSRAGFAFTLFTPDATLFTDDAQQIPTHFFSPNPQPDRRRRHPRDLGTLARHQHSLGCGDGQATVRPDAIDWLRVEIKGAATGPTGGDKLTRTKFIQRINTVGGLAPATDCSGATDVGNKAFVPYTADYLFYKVNTPEQ